MTLTKEQLEILVLDSALDSHKAYVARCKRRTDQAQAELQMAYRDQEEMTARLQYLRESLLRRGCV